MSDTYQRRNRRKRKRRGGEEEVEMQMGPMIDMVFLLLVFFMVTAKPIQRESDINIGLPGTVEQSEAVDIPDELRIQVQNGGQVVLNDLTYDSPESSELPQLTGVLKRLKQSAEANKSKVLVTLALEPAVRHQRIIDVLNACAIAEIKGVTFDSANTSAEGDF
ncbi:MAG: biopolymer transport protein ExbD [Verrucomicrobiales bacterium]|jgi:biopolymer transport protein ExbD